MNGEDEIEHHRKLFHTTDGRIQFSRLIEQLIPGVVIGAVVIFANFKVMESQVSSLRDETTNLRVALAQTVDRATLDRSEIVKLQAQMTSYLGQQVDLNKSTNERLQYVERWLIQYPPSAPPTRR